MLATLASWDPSSSQGLHGWLGATLIIAYPDLAAAPPPGSAGDNRFEALLKAGLILPVLDGLDEIPESARPRAITRINEELEPGEQVVVTCRTEQYQAAVSPQGGQGAALRAAAVQLCTLEFGEVATYLRRDAGPVAEGRWEFLDRLSAESPARQALATPLMAGLARVIYNPRPGEHAGKLPDPAELCGFADRAAVEAHLFDEFITAAYRSPARGRWTAERAETWLVFLAGHLEQGIGGPDLAWWQLRRAVPLPSRLAESELWDDPGVYAALVLGAGLGLAAWLALGPWAGFMSWVAGTFVGALGFGLSTETPAWGIRISGQGLRLGIATGLVLGGLAGLGIAAGLGGVAGLGFGRATVAGLVTGLVVCLVTGLVVGLFAGLAPGDLVRSASPRAVLVRDRRVALLLMLTGVLVGVFAGALGAGFGAGLGGALGLGISAGLLVGLGLSMGRTAWPSYALAAGWLALRHRLPWSLMSFLVDAHRREVLRQAGVVYQFRHLELHVTEFFSWPLSIDSWPLRAIARL